MSTERPASRYDEIAAQYVLGTLRGDSRERFEAKMLLAPQLQALVAQWEQRLLPMVSVLPPVTPSAKVWTGIEQRLFTTRAVPKIRWWQQFSWGTALVGGLLIAGASALITSQVITQRDNSQRDNTQRDAIAPASMLVAALDDSTGVTSVLLRIDPAGNERRALVSVAVVRPAQLTAAQVLELWAIAPGAAPRSLGLLPSAQSGAFRARGTVSVNDTLAISIEPAGGSTTGAPTGPVILQGKPRLL